jgi:hypothetical protein
VHLVTKHDEKLAKRLEHGDLDMDDTTVQQHQQQRHEKQAAASRDDDVEIVRVVVVVAAAAAAAYAAPCDIVRSLPMPSRAVRTFPTDAFCLFARATAQGFAYVHECVCVRQALPKKLRKRIGISSPPPADKTFGNQR